MGVLNPNSTPYVHPNEPNLLNIHKAMEYRDGIPHLRVNLGSDNITITGDVNLVDTVNLSSSTLAALETITVSNTSFAITNFPTTSTVYQGTIPWATTITNWPALQYVNGVLYAVQSGTWSVGVSGSVSVSNFTSTVNVASLPAVSGTVAISSLPAITGTVVVSNFTSTVRVDNIPTSITVTNFTSTVNISSMPAISGTVAISSLPAITGTVVVSGSVTMTNFTSTVNISSMPAVTGTVVVSNFTSTVRVDNFPTSVTVTNFTSTVFVSNTLTISNTSFAITNFPTTSTVYQGTTPWVVTGTVRVQAGDDDIGTEVSYVRADNNTQMDLSGRLRISYSGQQWWFVPMIDKDGDLRYGEYNTGTNSTCTFVQNLASVYLTSGTADNGQATRYSRRRHKLRPGVSHQWFCSLNFDGIQPNVAKRAGMFTNFNGYFFEVSDDLYAVTRRRLTDGTLVETRVKRDEFSHDRLDGTGVVNPSGFNWLATTSSNLTAASTTTVVAISTSTGNYAYQVTYTHDGTADDRFTVGDKVVVTGMTPTTMNNTPIITALTTNTVRLAYALNPGTFSSMSSGMISKNGFTRHHTLFMDFNGSRSGHVRFCIMGPLGPETLHVFDFSDDLGTASTNAPALMERMDIVNTGPVDHLPSMTTGGSSFNIEAELELNPGFGVASAAVPITFNKNTQVGSEFAVIGVGLRTGEPYQRADLQVNKLQMVDLGNLNPQNSGIFQWRLVLNPTLIGAIPTPINAGKASRYWDYGQGITCSTGTGITLMAGYAQGTFIGDTKTALNFLNMGSNLTYTDADKVVLFVKLLVGGTDNSSVVATIDFTESL